MARKIWLAYAIATVVGALVLLAIYVNAYDDYDVGDRLRGVGRFGRQAMALISAPLGPMAGFVADPPLGRAFGCGDLSEPCAFFVGWNTRFAALVAQIVLLRLAIARWRRLEG